jgi:hypothetical protein
MDPVTINDELEVGVCPDYVLVTMTGACTEDGATLPHETFLLLSADDAVKFANAILAAVPNIPEEDLSHIPDDLYLQDGSLNPVYAE